MSLTIVTGRPNAGKTGLLYDVVRRAVGAGQTAVVLLPSHPDTRAVAAEFAQYGPRIGVAVQVLDEYIDELWALHGDERRIVDVTDRTILISRALTSSRLDALADSIASTGLQTLLASLASNISSRPTPLSKGTSAAREIAEVLSAYERFLGQAERIERAEAARWLAEHAQSSWFSGPLVVNRFADLRSFQERLLVAAAARTDVWLALPWEEGFAATRALDPLVSRLRAGRANLVALQPGGHTRSEELRYVESHLFLDPGTAIGALPQGNVRLSTAYGEEAETERIVAEVQSALHSGVAPGQIAVVFQHVAEHAASLRASFRTAGIRADFDVIERARDTGWGKALAQLLRYAASGARSDLLGFLRSSYSGEPRETVECVEAYWRRHGIRQAGEAAPSLAQHCPGTARLVRETSSQLQRGWDGGASKKWQDLADELLRNAYGRKWKILAAEEMLDMGAHRAFLGLASSIDALPSISVSAAEFIQAFEELIVTSPAIPTGEAVRVMSASRARAQRFKVVIIGGLSAGDFPRLRREDPLAAPEMIAALRCCGIEAERKDERDAARLVFYLVASRATELLVLSRQVAAADGSQLRASWLWDEFLDVYRDPASDDAAEDALPRTFTLTFDDHALASDAPRSLRRALRACAQDGARTGEAASDSRLDLAARRARPREARLADEQVLERLSERRVFSATEIEAYLRCPYAWFHERVIRAQPLEPQSGAVELGRVCHDVLRRVFGELADAGEPRVTPTNLASVLKIGESALSEAIADEARPEDVDRLAMAASAGRKLLGFLRAEADFLPGFVPISHELEFGEDEGLFAGFDLRGRADRVDRGPEGGLVLTDYKTGLVGAGHSARKFADTGLVQLALYAKVAERRFSERVIGGLYRRVSSRNVASSLNRGFFDAQVATGPGLVSTDLMSRDEVEAVIHDAEERAYRAVLGMRSGDIAPEPRQPRTCLWCTLRCSCPGVQQ